MRRTKLERKLKAALPAESIKSEEYQDKYFLMKKIHGALPNLSDALIYDIIDSCNIELASPIKRDEFIKTFINQIFHILHEKI